MELEDWVKKDMRRYIKRFEPKEGEANAVRHEDVGILKNQDYERNILRALKQNRFSNAVELFEELKRRFMEIPMDHQEERQREGYSKQPTHHPSLPPPPSRSFAGACSLRQAAP